MSNEIIIQSNFFLYSICIGIGITFFYDLIKIGREVIPHNHFFESLEDLLFWVISSIIIFSVLYKVNNGMIRWFTVAGAFLGMFLYKKSLSQYIVSISAKIINKTLHIVKQIFMFVITPIIFLKNKAKLVFKPVRESICKTKKNTKTRLTQVVKKGKIALCKREKNTEGEKNSYEQKI